ncbi:toxin Fic [Campylobacterota bacterium]|nr:toxin Fic [Campylobacterota bacterium]
MDAKNGEMIIYQADDGSVRVETRLENETLWLTQKAMAELFQTSRPNITMHLKNIFDEGELQENSVCKDFLHTAADNKTYQTQFYNLDAIISVGYRVNSAAATKFRQWATARLREYIIKGFTMDDERLKGTGGGNYWKELLDRIRDIRSSEKVMYRQVLDLYATSIDYDPKSKETIAFFKTVQNKLHYAANQQTAAELISSRADADKDFMGLSSFAGALPIGKDVVIAKNYLTEDELFRLNRLVSAFFDLAEIKAMEHSPMHMKDWVGELDKFAQMYGKGVLQGAGTISHDEAIDKAKTEYKKYQVKTLSPVEQTYLETIKTAQRKAEKRSGKKS